MKIRLAHTQALLLLLAVLMAVLAMGALNAWNLRNGFSDFLASRDLERLEQFAQLVSDNAQRDGGIEAMQAKGTRLPELFQQFGSMQGGRPPPGASNPDMGPPAWGEPPGHPSPHNSMDAFKDRVAVCGLDGTPLLGKPLPTGDGTYAQRPVRVNQEVVAHVRMVQLRPVPDEVEMRFLSTQYQSIAAVACGLLLVAWMAALGVSRYWVRPLTQIQAATQSIAGGALDTRLTATRGDEIGDTMRNINQMAESLQKLEGARRQWIAEMSHELRTPLTVLRAELEALIDGLIAHGPQALHSLHEEVLKLNALVDDLHLLAMADLKALPCYFEEVDAHQLLERMVHRFDLRAAQRGLALSLDMEGAGPLWVRWDAKRIEQLLGNLLDNSLRYTDAPGRVVIRLLRGHGSRVVIEIDDTAPGVSAHDLPRIFEPLYRADPTRGRSTGGSGLGLAICVQIVKAHQGTLEVATSELGGMKFRLELPLVGDATP